MPFKRSDIKKPAKWKGTPEMREVADGECWEDFMGLMEIAEGDKDGLSSEQLVHFHSIYYMKVGHSNLGRMYVALAKAIAIDAKARQTA